MNGSNHVGFNDTEPMSPRYVVCETELRSMEHQDRVETCSYQNCPKKLTIKNVKHY